MSEYYGMSMRVLQQIAAEVCDEIATRTMNHATFSVLPHIKKYANKTKEHFFVVTLDGQHKIIKVHTVSVGTVNRTIVHAREVFVDAIRDHATAVIVGHNHPSGNLQPSSDDIGVIKKMVEAGKIIGIQVLDHITIAKTGYRSALESGDMHQ